MGQTNINSSVEEKVEVIIKVIKKEFPGIAPDKQAELLKGIVTVDLKG